MSKDTKVQLDGILVAAKDLATGWTASIAQWESEKSVLKSKLDIALRALKAVVDFDEDPDCEHDFDRCNCDVIFCAEICKMAQEEIERLE